MSFENESSLEDIEKFLAKKQKKARRRVAEIFYEMKILNGINSQHLDDAAAASLTVAILLAEKD